MKWTPFEMPRAAPPLPPCGRRWEAAVHLPRKRGEGERGGRGVSGGTTTIACETESPITGEQPPLGRNIIMTGCVANCAWRGFRKTYTTAVSPQQGDPDWLGSLTDGSRGGFRIRRRNSWNSWDLFFFANLYLFYIMHFFYFFNFLNLFIWVLRVLAALVFWMHMFLWKGSSCSLKYGK